MGQGEKPDAAKCVTRPKISKTAKLRSLFLSSSLFVEKNIQPFGLKVSQYFLKLSNFGVYGNE